MSAEPTPIILGEVRVADGVVFIRGLDESDTDVVQVVGEADDVVEATRLCLRIGARAVRAAHVAVDVDLIERSFHGLEARLGATVSEAVRGIAETADGLLDDEDGALTGTLSTFRADMDRLLEATFDPESKVSALAKIEDLVGAVVDQTVHAVGRLVAPEGDDSPLARLKHEVLAGFRTELDGVVREVRTVSERLGIAAATADMYEQTTGKGFDFEDVVDEKVGGFAAMHGDLAEQVGTEPGVTASRVGDEIVTLNRDDTHGIEARFVLEAKNRKLNMRATMSELDEALANRDALAAIAVFRSQDQAPVPVPFHYCDCKAIAVLDPDDGDDSPLRLAYLWARWTVRRSLGASEHDDLDLERVTRLLDDARRAIERSSTIKRCHSTAKREITKAGEQVAELVAEISEALDELDEALRS
jgi:hypothetical protein